MEIGGRRYGTDRFRQAALRVREKGKGVGSDLREARRGPSRENWIRPVFGSARLFRRGGVFHVFAILLVPEWQSVLGTACECF